MQTRHSVSSPTKNKTMMHIDEGAGNRGCFPGLCSSRWWTGVPFWSYPDVAIIVSPLKAQPGTCCSVGVVVGVQRKSIVAAPSGLGQYEENGGWLD